MIDEFQDTDPVQYSIFDRVYRVEKNCPAQALILIGDPKYFSCMRSYKLLSVKIFLK